MAQFPLAFVEFTFQREQKIEKSKERIYWKKVTKMIEEVCHCQYLPVVAPTGDYDWACLFYRIYSRELFCKVAGIKRQ